MLPIAPSNPATASLYALLHLDQLRAEVDGERRAHAARPAPHRGAPLRTIFARRRTDPDMIFRRLTRPIRTARFALAALAFAAGVGGFGSVASAATQAEPQPRPLLSKPAPERSSNIIAVLIGL